MKEIEKAAQIIKQAKRTTAFTGAGISVESGIAPFRGKGGLWNEIDPDFVEINYFITHPAESWEKLMEVFYAYFGQARANAAHFALADMEAAGYLHAVITQNIDNLHREAGSRTVYEFHGNLNELICTHCYTVYDKDDIVLKNLPPRCPACFGIIKPNVVFFGEGIPEEAAANSFREADLSDVFLIIGSTGEVYPAASIPGLAKQNGAKIIEVNIDPSLYTAQITDVFLQGKATEMMRALSAELNIL